MYARKLLAGIALVVAALGSTPLAQAGIGVPQAPAVQAAATDYPPGPGAADYPPGPNAADFPPGPNAADLPPGPSIIAVL